MDNKILVTLEYSKIIHKLLQHTATIMGKRKIEELKASSDLEDVKHMLQATDEAYKADRLKGSAPFWADTDIAQSLHRARIGGTLNPSELLDIAFTSRGGRRVNGM